MGRIEKRRGRRRWRRIRRNLSRGERWEVIEKRKLMNRIENREVEEKK